MVHVCVVLRFRAVESHCGCRLSRESASGAVFLCEEPFDAERDSDGGEDDYVPLMLCRYRVVIPDLEMMIPCMLLWIGLDIALPIV